MRNFADRLTKAVQEKGTCAVVGIDPRLENIPAAIRDSAFKKHGTTRLAAAEAVLAFSRGVIDAVSGVVPAVKPQSAFFELFGWEGVRAFAETVSHAKSKGLIVISDVKRSDIGSTADAYARAHLGSPAGLESSPGFDSDAVTVNPYLGTDGLKPFADIADKEGKGVFVLARTSNPSAGELQDALRGSDPVFLAAGRLAESVGRDMVGKCGFSSVGIVAGATFPGESALLRKELPNTVFLVPGYGAQGATAADLKPFFTEKGGGVLVNASRSVIFAYGRPPFDEKFGESRWQDAVNAAAVEMVRDLAGISRAT